MMEEQNQEKATATQHVTVADAAAPETGNGKKEDKGGGKKEKKTAKPLTPKQLQQRKKLMVYPLMGLLFLGSMWLIFAPSEEQGVNRDTVGAFNADIPLPENDGIIGDKRKAYEQAQAEKQQAEKVRSLEDFAFSEESDTDGVEMELPVTRNFAASLFRNIKYFTLRKLYLCRKWMQKRLQKTTTTGITLPNFDFLA